MATERFNLTDEVRIDYFADPIIAMIIAGMVAYFIHRINHNAIEKSFQESNKNEEQYNLIKNLQGSIIETSEKLTAHSWDLTVGGVLLGAITVAGIGH
jgi:Co/Zn/Cd efflux system component